MKLHLSDLDELCENVRNSQARKYLEEAIASYRSGAYRAALITTWISVCVDVIEKIRELSLSGDASAQAIESKLDGIRGNDINGMLDFERKLLDFACDQLQLISLIEKTHLERLREDRNICAHPTFSSDGSQFNPSPELVRAYVVQVANYLLVQAPVQGKVVIAKTFELIQETSFPENDEEAFSVLSSNHHLGRARESSIRNLTIILLKRIFQDDTVMLFDLFDRISSALGAISRISPETYSAVLDEKLSRMLGEANDTKLRRIIPFLERRNEAWEKLDTSVSARFPGLMRSMSVADIIKYRLVSLATQIPEFGQVFLTHVATLEDNEVEDIVKSVSSPILKQYAISFFCNSGKFDIAKRRGKMLVPYGEYFDDADLEVVFKGILENRSGRYNQILSATGMGSILVGLYTATKKRVMKHKELWLVFWEQIQEEGHAYPDLQSVLVEDGLITMTLIDDADNGTPF